MGAGHTRQSAATAKKDARTFHGFRWSFDAARYKKAVSLSLPSLSSVSRTLNRASNKFSKQHIKAFTRSNKLHMAFFGFPFPDEVENLFDRLVNDRFGPGAARALEDCSRRNSNGQPDGTVTKPSRPRIDVIEVPNSYVVTADLPGVKKEDISIDLHNNRLTISGESKSSSEHSEGNVKVSERRFGHFSRTVSVPEGTPQDQIKASFESGVLRVELPKATPKEAKRIEIA